VPRCNWATFQSVRYNWSLINEFGKRTGVPVLMNSSFNLRGETIVNNLTDAIRTILSSAMDALVFGSFLVQK
jgi:carbamoyltransferase